MMRVKPQQLKTVTWPTLLCTSMLSMSVAFAQSETDPEVLFNKGLKSRDKGELQESIEAFQSILSIEPTLNRARLELATAYFKALNYAEARRQAQQVLDDPQTPEPVKENIRRFLKDIAAADIRHTITPFAYVGVTFDSNVNSGPSRATFQDIVLPPSANQTSDHALTISTGVSHRYLSPISTKIAGHEASFGWNSAASFYRLDYNQQHAFDLDVISLGTGPAWIIADKGRGGINLQADEIRLGNNRFATFVGINPSLTAIFNKGKTEVTGDLSVQKRFFHRASENGRDSDYTAVGIGLGQVVGLSVAIQVGARYFNEHADLSFNSNDGYEVSAGVNWLATKTFSLFGRVSYRDSKAKAADPLFAIARQEQQSIVTVGMSYRFIGSFLDQWVLSANYVYTDNKSNINLSVYDREQVNLTVGRAF